MLGRHVTYYWTSFSLITDFFFPFVLASSVRLIPAGGGTGESGFGAPASFEPVLLF